MSFGSLSLPQPSKAIQVSNKKHWNSSRRMEDADFFTVGYIGKSIDELVVDLKAAGVKTLVDIRFNPVSQYKPEFSKGNLQTRLANEGIAYLHRSDWGVPREIREDAVDASDRQGIWEWYEGEVIRRYFNRNLDVFFNWADHPVALMCMELDPTNCHRHLVCQALERHGLRGYDL